MRNAAAQFSAVLYHSDETMMNITLVDHRTQFRIRNTNTSIITMIKEGAPVSSLYLIGTS